MIVTVETEILLKSLVESFSLTIALGVVTRSEVKTHIESCAKRAEEVGDELGATIGGNVFGNTVFREDVDDKEFSEFSGGNGGVAGDEDTLL